MMKTEMKVTGASCSETPGEFKEDATVKFQFKGPHSIAMRIAEAIKTAMTAPLPHNAAATGGEEQQRRRRG